MHMNEHSNTRKKKSCKQIADGLNLQKEHTES